MTDSRQQILVVAGPTASGKTALALSLARTFDAELVGADSVQVYRDFDIGSAKPSTDELGTVPHHLLSVADPTEVLDAADYARLADAAIAEIGSRGKLPIVVGGTGLWIRALLRGLVDVPPVDPALRARLEQDAEVYGSEALHVRLHAVDPITAEKVHPNDALRIIRALEVFEQTGQPLGELRQEHALGTPRYRAHMVALDPSADWLVPRIEQRIDQMFEAGFVDEVRTIRQRWGDDVRALGSVGYREVLEHLRDGVPIDETKRRIRKATRVYARRQRTWFRSDPNVTWTVPIESDADDIATTVGGLVGEALSR